MRRNLKALIVTMTFLLLFHSMFSSVFSDSYGQGMKDGEIKLSVEIGYDGFFKLGSTIPFYFDIENNLKDINGELQVEMPDDYGNITLYSINVSLPQNTAKQFVMYIPMTRYNTKLKMNIVQGNKTVLTKSVNLASSRSADTLVIGMLSDDYESIRYINTVPISNFSNFKTATVHIDENQFPQELDALKMFNILVINNFDTSKLNSKQYEVLKSWVNDGGLLLIGTGPSYSKTLAAFKDQFLSGKAGSIQTVNTAALYTLMSNTASAETMELNVLDIDIEGSTIVASEGSLPLVQKLQKKNGVVAVAAFDFGLEPLTSWIGNRSFAEGLLKKVLPSYYSNTYFEKDLMMRENYYAIDSSLKNIPELPQPKTTNLIVMFVVYILIAAPISYIVLKKMDKRELMWITVPAVAVLFSVVIYITGYGTRLTEPLANIISIVDMDGKGSIVSRTYAGVFTPNKNNLRLEAGENVSIKPMNSNGYYMYGPMPSENEPKKVISKVILAPKQAIEFYNIGVWGIKNVILQNRNEIEGKIESKLSYSNKKINGTVTNLSEFDLEDCYLITSNQYMSIGNVKNGESINIDKAITQYYGNRYDLLNAIYQDPYSNHRLSKLSEKEVAELRENLQRRQVFEYYFWGESNPGAVKIIGWSSTPFSEELLVNGNEVKKIEKTFVVSSIELDYRHGDAVEYPFGHITPIIINNLSSGNYDEMGKTFYGRGSAEVHYEIDRDIIPEEITIQSNVTSSNTVKYIWNLEISNWEQRDIAAITLKDDDIMKYLDSNNTLRLRFELNDDSMALPQIAVKGSVK